MIKNKYKSEYKASTRLTSGGKMVQDYYYIGEYYCLPLNEQQKKKAKVSNLLFGLAMLLLTLTAGMMNPDSSRTLWIVLPYMCILLPCAYMLLGVWNFWDAPVRMEHSVYNASVVRMQRSCWGVIIVAFINIVLDIAFILVYNSEINIIKESLYCLVLAAVVFTGIGFGKFYDRTYVPVTMEQN